MAHDWLDPLLTDTLADYTAAIISGLTSLAKQDLSADANKITGSIQFNSTGDKWEIWSGSAWSDLASKYGIDVDTVDGLHAADLAPIAHVGSFGVSAHAVATASTAGFMSASDKTDFNARTSAATANALMQRDASGRAKVAAPSASDDIARKNETDAVQTNLTSHEGSGGSAHAAATSTVNGFMSSTMKNKLDGIEASADVNQTDSELLTQIKNVDGAGSGLDADTVDGIHAADLGVSQTVVNTGPNTSGTAVEFTGLPAGIAMLTLSIADTSLSGSDELQVQLGHSGAYHTSGYAGSVYNGANTAWSAGAILNRSSSASYRWSGGVTIVRTSANRFSIFGGLGVTSASTSASTFGGFIVLSGELTRLKLMSTGSNTFDAGFVTLTYLN